ncbi:MAG TPA: PQQ-dependent sugar dehydrogenase [Methylomirabilota bacterium]|nr:PQQ-dependent sugar dehydrogenase [Methylomirabilota bacterium]
MLALIASGLSPLWLGAQPQSSSAPAEIKGWRAVRVADGIEHPWGMTWLPDGRALVTAKEGHLYLLADARAQRVEMPGIPRVFAGGQGGLMDIAVHPSDGSRIYMTVSTGSRDENRTTLVRGVFRDGRVSGIETLFQVDPPKSGAAHFGSRLLWLPDGTLLMTVGDGGNPPQRVGAMLAREQAQNLQTHLGKVLRLTEDGKPAPDNPLAKRPEARPEVWTYGHRNIQGIARDPGSGRIWASEHGPYGGDEVNLLEAGRNYGWPLQSLGRDYRTREPIGQPSVPGMVDALVVWSPSKAPSGLAFYTGPRYGDWKGSLFSGGLVTRDVRRLILDGQGRVTGQERLSMGARVRDVRQGPDGYLYVLTDESNGKVLRIERP